MREWRVQVLFIAARTTARARGWLNGGINVFRRVGRGRGGAASINGRAVFADADEELADDHGEDGDADEYWYELGAGGGLVDIGDVVPDDGNLDSADDNGCDGEVDEGLHLFEEAETEVSGGMS